MELFDNPHLASLVSATAQLMFGLVIGIIGAYSAGYMHGLEKGEAKIKKQ